MGIIGDIATTAVVAGTWTAVSNRVSRRQAGRWAAQNQSQQSAYRPPPPGRYQRPMFQPTYGAHHPTPPTGDVMTQRLAQLQQLGDLKARGVLTEAEFQAQKQIALNS